LTALTNWANEFEKFCPAMKVLVYHGSQKERFLLFAFSLIATHKYHRSVLQFEVKREGYEVILTTYNIVYGKSDRAFLKSLAPYYLVLGNQRQTES